MKHILKSLTLVVLGIALFTSCTKNETFVYNIEHVTVQFNSKELLETKVKPFGKVASTTSTTNEYEHVFPTSYKAYFVSKESKGEYKVGDVVKVIDVVSGGNTITIPKLDYEIYVTNYVKNDNTEDKPFAWYKTTGISVLPAYSDKLYLFGAVNIDYSVATEGTVELTNPYSAVMIRNNQWLSKAPTYNYGNHPEYKLIDTELWYLLYIKGNSTQTTVHVDIPGRNSNNYQLQKSIEANKEYRFTIDGSIENLNNGSFFVDVKPMEKVVEEVIKL